jgi:hypothetical protein
MELRSCYFCGVAGRTVESRTLSDVAVTLCPRCEEKLVRIRDATDAGPTETTPVTFDAPDDDPGRPSAGADGEEPSIPADDDPVEGGTNGPVDGDTVDAPADDGHSADAPADDETAADPANDPPADGTVDGAESSGRPESTGLRGLDADDRGRRSTYRKALRLLRNREFPMTRSDTIDLLASAYDLDREECDRLLDLCVDRGLLSEEDGELREP